MGKQDNFKLFEFSFLTSTHCVWSSLTTHWYLSLSWVSKPLQLSLVNKESLLSSISWSWSSFLSAGGAGSSGLTGSAAWVSCSAGASGPAWVSGSSGLFGSAGVFGWAGVSGFSAVWFWTVLFVSGLVLLALLLVHALFKTFDISKIKTEAKINFFLLFYIKTYIKFFLYDIY